MPGNFTYDKVEQLVGKLGASGSEGGWKVEERGKHTYYSYLYRGKVAFKFWLWRDQNKRKNASYYHVPRSMNVQNKVFREICECPITKEEFNSMIPGLYEKKYSKDYT